MGLERSLFLRATVCSMHKVLFMAYDFPPCRDRGGSLRSEKFVKYLPCLGWSCGVLSWSQCKGEVEEAYPCVNRIPSLTPWNRPYHVTPYGWLLPLYLQGCRLLSSDRYDLIYVSCPPFPQSIVTSRFRRHAGVPLVVDFRDAWSMDPYVEGSRLKKVLYKTVFPALERKVLADADLFIVNTPSTLEAYLEKYPSLAGRISMIPNGYDEEDFVDYRPKSSQREMNILYCGRFSVGGRDPMPLLKAFKQLVEQGLAVRLSLIGDYGRGLSKSLAELNLMSHVRLSSQVSHKEAIRSMADCDVLVLYQEPSRSPITPIAGKTYEYIRSGKAILAIVPPGDNLNIVRRYASRYAAATHDVRSITQAIRSLYSDWEKGSLGFYTLPNARYIRQYNRRALTARLAAHFDRLVSISRHESVNRRNGSGRQCKTRMS